MFGMMIALISIYRSIYPEIEILKAPRALDNGVVITFDDGPHPTHTAEILDILKQKRVHATFFLIGLHIRRDQKVIQREAREGHTVGGHSYSHRAFSKLGLSAIATEILLTQIKIASLVGKYPTYFRFPYGVDDIRIRNFYSGKIISWNVDAYDWKAKNPKLLASKIVSQTRTGSIILLHDIKADTVKALPYIIDGIRAKKLEFTTLPSLIASMPREESTNIEYYSKYKTGALHDHRKIKKPPVESTEGILEPLIFTEVAPW